MIIAAAQERLQPEVVLMKNSQKSYANKPNSKAAKQEYNDHGEPMPPEATRKRAEHHWLNLFTADGAFLHTAVFQWSPQDRRWCHSGDLATSSFVSVTGARYVGICPMPDLTGNQLYAQTREEFELFYPGLKKLRQCDKACST